MEMKAIVCRPKRLFAVPNLTGGPGRNDEHGTRWAVVPIEIPQRSERILIYRVCSRSLELPSNHTYTP